MQYKHLALEERFLIHKLFQEGTSRRNIGRKLNRSHSTIIREVRNTGKRGYRYKQAKKFAKRRRTEASCVPRKMAEELWAIVEELLVRKRWSLEQIAGRLALQGVISVSVKWIYKRIWKDRAAGGALFRNLRRRGKKPNRRGRDDCGRGVQGGHKRTSRGG